MSSSVKYTGNTTDSTGMYSATTAMSTSAIVRRSRLCHTNFNPSSVPCQMDVGRVAVSGLPACSRRRNAIVATDSTNPAAATHNVFTAPTVAMRTPPMPGPTEIRHVVVGLVETVHPVE